MEKYIKPIIEIEIVEVEDVIATSNGKLSIDGYKTDTEHTYNPSTFW